MFLVHAEIQECICKHIRSAVIGLAHALCRDTWQARRCVVIVLVLRNSGCTTVYNKSKLTVTEAHTITLQYSDAPSLSLEYVVKDSQHFSFNVKEDEDHVTKSLQFSFLDQVMTRRFSTVTFESLDKIHGLSSIWFDFRMFD